MNQPHASSLCDVDETEHDTLSHAYDRVSEAGHMLEGGACAVWHKAALGVAEALALGVLCNGLVCLARLAGHGRAQRGGQSAGDCLPDHGLRDDGLRALDCQPILSDALARQPSVELR